MRRAKRIAFTELEIDVLISLCAVAEAFSQSEGDYQTFTEAHWHAVNTASAKLAELLRRKTSGASKDNRE